jgi:hypothetical protein
MKYLPSIVMTAVVLSVLGVAGGSNSQAEPDVRFLTSDLHFVIGGHNITVPAVALRGLGHTFDLNPRRVG